MEYTVINETGVLIIKPSTEVDVYDMYVFTGSYEQCEDYITENQPLVDQRTNKEVDKYKNGNLPL